ncbi:hypothetical protein CFOL_v3_06494, partial [Cephalotus follicularis]
MHQASSIGWSLLNILALDSSLIIYCLVSTNLTMIKNPHLAILGFIYPDDINLGILTVLFVFCLVFKLQALLLIIAITINALLGLGSNIFLCFTSEDGLGDRIPSEICIGILLTHQLQCHFYSRDKEKEIENVKLSLIIFGALEGLQGFSGSNLKPGPQLRNIS